MLSSQASNVRNTICSYIEIIKPPDICPAVLVNSYLQEEGSMGVLDVLIVVAGAVVFGLSNALYAIVSIAGTTVISGRIQEGVRFAKSVYIISDKNDEIADYIDRELDRGVTYIEAIGYHTGQHRHMLYTVVNKKELGLLKYKVSRTDKNSFMIVGDVREVFGEGWQIPGKQMY